MSRNFGLVVPVLLVLACGGSDKSASSPSEPAASQPALSLELGPNSYAFSNADSEISFKAAKITRSHDGAFKTFRGVIELPDAAKPESGSVKVEIEVASIETDTPDMTKHLKTADLLDVGKFPKASFVSTSLAPSTEAGATHQITGDFTLHGVTKTITFPASIQAEGGAISVDADVKLNRQDFGVTYPGMPDDLIKDDVFVKLKVRAKKATS